MVIARTLLSAVAIVLLAMPMAAIGWEFTEEEADGSCSVGQIFEGEGSTIFFFSQDQEQFDDDDIVQVSIGNENWSIASGEELGTVKFENDDGAWFSNDGIGITTDQYRAIITTVSFEHLDTVMGGYPRSLTVTRGASLIDQLSLTGMTLEYSQFKRCRDKKVAVVAERERQHRLKDAIPRDPFSN